MKSYHNGTLTHSIRQIYSLYKENHPLFRLWMLSKRRTTAVSNINNTILNIISDKKSMWVDSFGYGLSTNCISVEQYHYRPPLKNLPNIYFRKNLNNINTCKELVQTFNPEIVVYYKSEFFKYLTVPELIAKLKELQSIYNNLIIYMDLLHTDYNKLKYPVTHIISQIHESFPDSIIKRHALSAILINI